MKYNIVSTRPSYKTNNWVWLIIPYFYKSEISAYYYFTQIQISSSSKSVEYYPILITLVQAKKIFVI